ncbi:MAG TPA: zinc-dependent metalloprotease [Mycobacteriales bacterium]|nr:zinc-dependent metalloprotease [Mycobacteriales bacterium]
MSTDPTASGSPGEQPGVPDLGAMLRQLGDLMSGQTGPVNWNLAEQGAMQAIGADAGTTAADTQSVTDAVRLADLWLDAQTALPSGVSATEAWSRRRWLKATQPAWARLVEPVATKVIAGFGDALPEEMRAAALPLMGVMQQVGGLMFGSQIGLALGSLAKEVVSATDIGLPLGPAGTAALLPENVNAFGAGLGVPPEEVRIFLALREAAHHRLFGHTPWLTGRLYDAVRDCAEAVTVDMSQLEQLAGSIDPTNMESMQEALSGGMFTPEPTPEHQAALGRLETLLALIEGWVDTVTLAAATGSLPSISALNETMRRRRATGAPSEQALASLVGLQMRPRRLRDAAALWALLADRRGLEGRDAIWSHPDLMPGGDDLDDPFAFVDRDGGPELDISALEE